MTIILQSPTPLADGTGTYAVTSVTLREIEQEVARRVGPFLIRTVTNFQAGDPPTPTSSVTQIGVKSMRSNLDLGGMEDRYVLRRGRLADGTRLPNTDALGAPMPFVDDDRIRLIRQYNPTEGTIEVDDPYLYPTYDGEEIEIHHLDPEQELRPTVLAGLRRCWIVDLHALPQAIMAPFGTFDLTQTAPWIGTRDQVYDVAFPGGAPMTNWRVEQYGGGVTVRLGEWSPSNAFIVNRRPAATKVLPAPWPPPPPPPVPPEEEWVYRAGSPNEAWSDEDRFAVPVDYAAAAGHIEAWRTARPRLTLTAQTGMWADQKETAAEFTRCATVYFDSPRHKDGLPMWPNWWWNSHLTNAGR
jgi:hypothetical protein